MSFVSILMISLTVAYSAPTENTTVSLNATSPSDSTTLDKPILRNQEDNTPGKCCTDPSKKCCPYDYDANNCETMDTRKLCGYDKNQKKPDSEPVHVAKMGLDCLMVEERLECGYERGPNNEETDQSVDKH